MSTRTKLVFHYDDSDDEGTTTSAAVGNALSIPTQVDFVQPDDFLNLDFLDAVGQESDLHLQEDTIPLRHEGPHFERVEVLEPLIPPPRQQPYKHIRNVSFNSRAKRERPQNDSETDLEPVTCDPNKEEVIACALEPLDASSYKNVDSYRLTLDERDLVEDWAITRRGIIPTKPEEVTNQSESGDEDDEDCDQTSSDEEFDDLVLVAAVERMRASCIQSLTLPPCQSTETDNTSAVTSIEARPSIQQLLIDAMKSFVETSTQLLDDLDHGSATPISVATAVQPSIERLERLRRRTLRPPPAPQIIIDGVKMDL